MAAEDYHDMSLLYDFDYYNQFGDKGMNNPKPENVKCPDCGGDMVSRTGKFGVFWGCKKYPNCKGTRDSQGRSKAEREAEKEEKGEDFDHSNTDFANPKNDYPFRKIPLK